MLSVTNSEDSGLTLIHIIYPKDGKTMFGLYLYGRKECGRFLNEVGLVEKEGKS